MLLENEFSRTLGPDEIVIRRFVICLERIQGAYAAPLAFFAARKMS